MLLIFLCLGHLYEKIKRICPLDKREMTLFNQYKSAGVNFFFSSNP